MVDLTEKEIMARWKDNMSSPLVSICCITYNHENFIAEALDSFLMQKTDFSFEIVIDDDCSTDNAAQIIQEYQNKFPNIIKANLRSKNVGLAENSKGCYLRAIGEFIAFCEGDDFWTDENKLSYQVSKMNEYPECDISVHPVNVLQLNNEENSLYGQIHETEKIISISKYMEMSTPYATSSTIIRKKVFEEHSSILNEILIIDYTVQVLGSLNGGILYLNKVMSTYRKHSGGVTESVAFSNAFLEKEVPYYFESFIKINHYLNFEWEKYFLQKINIILSYYWMGQKYAIVKNIAIYLKYKQYLSQENNEDFLKNLVLNITQKMINIQSLTTREIDFLRDEAVEIEKNNLKLAYELMEIAHHARPNGPFIEKKYIEYKKLLSARTPTEEIKTLNMPVLNDTKTEKMRLDLIKLYLEKKDLTLATEELNKLEAPWSLSVSEVSVDLLLDSNLTMGIEAAHVLLKDYLEKTKDRDFFLKTLSHLLLKNTAWDDRWGDKNKSPNYIFLTLLANEYKEYLDTITILIICGTHLNFNEYNVSRELLEDLQCDKEHQIYRDWILLVSKASLNKPITNISTSMIPDDILLDNTLYHYRYGNEKCMIMITTINQNAMGQMVNILSNLLKPLGISLIVVYDNNNKFSLTGIANYSLEESANQIKHITDKLKYKEIAFYGGSGPGLASAIFALRTNAKGVLGINASTFLPKNNINGNFDSDLKNKNVHDFFNNEEAVANMIVKVFGEESVPDLDIKKYLNENQHTLVMLMYSKQSHFDALNAEKIQSYPNVILKPIDHDNHFLLEYFLQNNIITDKFKEFMQKIGWINKQRIDNTQLITEEITQKNLDEIDQIDVKKQNPSKQNSKEIVAEQKQNEKEKIDTIKGHLKNSALDQAATELNKFKAPWSKLITQVAIDILLAYSLAHKQEKVHSLLNEYVERTANKDFFFKTLFHVLYRNAAWDDTWGNKSKSPNYLFLTLLATKYKNYLDPVTILHICGKHLNFNNYEAAIELLEDLECEKEYQTNRDWLLLVAKASSNKAINNISEPMVPNDVHLDNTLYHYRYGNEKCMIFITSVNQDSMGGIINILLKTLKLLEISLLIIFDNNNKSCLTGISNYSLEKSADKIKQVTENLQYKKISYYGSSAAGLSALVFALKTNANGVLGINALTFLPKNSSEGDLSFELKSKNANDFFESEEVVSNVIMKVFGEEPVPDLDIKKYLDANQNTLVMLMYSQKSHFDAVSAERLSSYRNVILKPYDHDNHFLQEYFIQKNIIVDKFKEFIQEIGWINVQRKNDAKLSTEKITQKYFDEKTQVALTLTTEKKYAEAEEILQRLLQHKKLFRVQAYNRIIQLYVAWDKLQAANNAALEGLQEYPENPWILRNITNVMIAKKQYDDAEKYLNRIPKDKQIAQDAEQRNHIGLLMQKQIDVNNQNPSKQNSKEIVAEQKQNEKEKLDTIKGHLKNSALDQAVTELNKFKAPWSKLVTQVAIDILLAYSLAHKQEKVHLLLNEYVEKIENKDFFFKTLFHVLDRNTAWYDTWGNNSKSPNYLFLTLLATKYKSYLDPVTILHICGKHLNFNDYDAVIELLEDLECEKEYQTTKDWLLLVARASSNKEINNISAPMVPDDIHLDNTLYHYRHGNEKCMIMIGAIEQSAMGKMIEILANLLKPLEISLIVVFDNNNKFGLTGIANYSLEESAKQLNLITTEKLQYKDIAFYSGSGPGLTAAVFALITNANGVLGMNALTFLPKNSNDGDLSSEAKTKNAHDFFESEEAVSNVIMKVFGEEPVPDLDIKKYLDANQNTLVMLMYSKKSPFDAVSAERLSSYRNVILKPYDHDNHFLLQYFFQNNTFNKKFEEYLQELGWINGNKRVGDAQAIMEEITQKDFDKRAQMALKLIAKKEFVEAEIILRRLLQDKKLFRVQAYNSLMQLYIAWNKFQEANEIAMEGFQEYPENLWILRNITNVMIAKKQYADAEKYLNMIPTENQIVQDIEQKIRINLLTDNAEEALNTIEQTEGTLPKHLTQNCVDIVLAYTNKATLEENFLLAKELAEKNEDQDHFYTTLLSQIWHKSELYDFWGKDPLTKNLALATEILYKIDNVHINPSFVLRIAPKLIYMNQIDKAIEMLQRFDFDDYESQMVRDWLFVLAGAYSGRHIENISEQMTPDDVLLDGSVFHYKYGDSKCILIFAGLSDNETGRILIDMMDIFKSYGISIMVIVDKNHYMSLKGLDRYSLDTSIMILDDIIDSFGYTDVMALGGSGTALAAQIYGLKQKNVQSVLGLNAITKIPKETADEDKEILYYVKHIFKGLEIEYNDSYELIKNNNDTFLYMIYSEKSPFDVKSVSRIKHFSNVMPLPVDHDNHNIIGYLLLNDLLKDEFDKIFTHLHWIENNA